MARVTSQTTPEGDMVTGPFWTAKRDALRQWFDVDGYLETLQRPATPQTQRVEPPPPPADPPAGPVDCHAGETYRATTEPEPVGFITFHGNLIDDATYQAVKAGFYKDYSVGSSCHIPRERPEPSVGYSGGTGDSWITWWHLWATVFFVIDMLILGTMLANLLTGRSPF